MVVKLEWCPVCGGIGHVPDCRCAGGVAFIMGCCPRCHGGGTIQSKPKPTVTNVDA